MKLTGKTAVVTGGTKGIGRATALALAEQGANVIATYAHDTKAAAALEQAAAKYPVTTTVIRADITDVAAVAALFEQIASRYDSIDILVNNAGIFDEADSPGNLAAMQRVYEADLFAQVRMTDAASKVMRRGKIIFISSIHGKLGHGRPSAIGYASSKAALESYMKNLAKALAPDILVNAIAPGRTLTPMWGDMTAEYKAEKAAGHLIGRWIEPEEIADGVLFLLKNDAVCGEVLIIDGGMSLVTLG